MLTLLPIILASLNTTFAQDPLPSWKGGEAEKAIRSDLTEVYPMMLSLHGWVAKPVWRSPARRTGLKLRD